MRQRTMRYSENCVYAVEAPTGVKIGFTSRLGDRLTAFQRDHGVACYPIALKTGLTRDKAKEIEAALHARLENHLISNEYFRMTRDEIIQEFKAFFDATEEESEDA